MTDAHDFTDPHVEFRGVTKRFGERVVLDGLDLQVAAGETVAPVGPSGAGKSTLLRCVNGLCPFDDGEIHVGPRRLLPHGRGGGGPRRAARSAWSSRISNSFRI